MSATRGNVRAERAERLLASIIDLTPDASLLSSGFHYEQHFGSTAGVYLGAQGLERWIETFYEVWDRASLTVEGVREAGDRLAIDILVKVCARQTGIEVEMRATHVVRFSADGSIARMDAFIEPADAESALLGGQHGERPE